MDRLRFQLLWKTGIHIQLLWDKRKAGSMRDFLIVRGLLNGQRLHRACCSGKRTGRQNCPGALCPAGWELFRNFRHSIPLAGYTAPRPSTMICSLLHLLAGWHWLTNHLPLTWHQSSQREVLPTAVTNAKHRGLHLCVWPTSLAV